MPRKQPTIQVTSNDNEVVTKAPVLPIIDQPEGIKAGTLPLTTQPTFKRVKTYDLQGGAVYHYEAV